MSDKNKDLDFMHGLEREPRLNNGVYIVRDKMKPIEEGLLSPHYTDNRFRERRYDGKVGERVSITVYLAPELDEKKLKGNQSSPPDYGLGYDYGDRIAQWYDKDLRDNAWKRMKELGLPKNSAAELEAYLRLLQNDSNMELKHIVTEVGVNGYPYIIYGLDRS